MATQNPVTICGVNSSGESESILSSSNFLQTELATAIAGERRPDSVDSRMAVGEDRNLTVINSQSAVGIGIQAANTARLLAVHVYGTLTGTCVIAGFEDDTGSAASITIPAGTTIPSNGAVLIIPYDGILNSFAAMTVTCSNAADADLVHIAWGNF